MHIFGKQLLIYLSVLVVSLVFLGLMLTRGIRTFLTDQQSDELTILARRVSHSVERFMEFGGVINRTRLDQEIFNIHLYTNATIAIIDSDFNSIGAYGLPSGLWEQGGFDEVQEIVAVFDIYEIAPVMEGSTVVVHGTANHPALEHLLFVGYPFRFDGDILGAALVGVSLFELEAAISDMYRITMISLGITAALAFVLIYISSRAISAPLRQINEAASVIASGEFDKALPVRGRDEVAQLCVQFNRMTESLREQERIRHTFIANLSHDIRSPLTSIRGFLMAIGDGTISREDAPHYIGIVLDETERLIKLSNDILDIHRIQDMEIKLEKTVFDINDLIRKTVLGFSRRATDKRLMVTSRFAHPVDMVEADEEKIRRTLNNLIENAVKFTPEGGEITVETTTAKGKVSVSVSDNGRGMTDEEMKHIFDRFYKGDTSRGEDKMGSGLGLSIVKAFIRAHGEQLSVESLPEQGSVFTFTLPVLKVAQVKQIM